MRRSFVWLALFLGCAATAQAGSLNLRWNGCFGDGGVSNRNFACDTNSGAEILIASFVMPTNLSRVSGNEIVVDVGFPGTSLPAWWDFKNAGTCRTTSLSMNFTQPASAAACVDWASGQSVGGLAAYTYTGYPYANFARIKAASAVPLEGLADLFAGQEYYSFSLLINHQKTVGTGSCPGCLLGACIYFRQLKLTTPTPQNDLNLYPGYFGTWWDALVTWQGGAGVVQLSNGNIVGCPAATPTKSRTWGEVKTLYR